jgi:formyltetrahydrofolate-dependent phosphoribosylglycinamide formyltransferase
MTRIGILFSGRGSNMGALLDAAQAPGFPGEVAVCLTNVPDAPGLELAQSKGATTSIIPHGRFGRDRRAHEAAMHQTLGELCVEVVCLAGYMRVLTPFMIERWSGRMLNIHPSLLPLFPGLNTHAQALAAGVKLHGCTVHLVTESVDCGPILAQAAVPVLPDDTEETLAARVLVQEHVIYPAALRLLIERRPGRSDPKAALLNPLPPAARAP